MPILANAKKALRSSKRKAAYNQPLRARIRTAAKSLAQSKSAKDLTAYFSALDKAAKKHVIHKGKADRLKSRAAKMIVKSTGKAAVKADVKPVTKATTKSKIKATAKSKTKSKAKAK